METRISRWLARAHILIWSALVLAIVVTGAPALYRDLATFSLHAPGPYHSTDGFLHFATGSSISSEELLTKFGAMPSSRTVLVFYNNIDPRSALLAMTTAYLAWPHPIRLIDITAARTGAEPLPNNSESVSALVFCRVNQSLLPDAHSGDCLKIVSLAP
jgi:hypothetical protein